MVDTNIVIVEIDDAPDVVAGLLETGVQVTPLGPQRLRVVTHLDVDRADVFAQAAAVYYQAAREVKALLSIPQTAELL